MEGTLIKKKLTKLRYLKRDLSIPAREQARKLVGSFTINRSFRGSRIYTKEICKRQRKERHYKFI